MKIIDDTQIIRKDEYELEYEIPVAYNIEELYKGSNDTDDPSHCVVNEQVEVLEDVGPFRYGDMLVLTDEERASIEEEALLHHLYETNT